MKGLIDKILERLEEATYRIDDSATLSTRDVVNEEDAKEIVQEVAEEYTSTDTSTNGWIPCSERLPDDGIDVLVWFEYYRFGNYNRLYQTIGISYTYNGEWSGFINGTSGWTDLRVIAWYQMPQPYKESE